MTTDNDTVEKILYLCEDEDGFFIQLRLHMQFNVAQYEEIRDAFLRYLKELGDEPMINRRVARFLLDMLAALEGSAHHMNLRDHPDTRKVQHAHAEMLDITYKLLP